MPFVVDSDSESEISVSQSVSHSGNLESSGSEAGESPAQPVNAEIESFEVSEQSNIRSGGNPARHWVFTIQAECPDDAQEDARRKRWRPPQAGKDIKYIVCQQERGAGTGRLHWQGYVQFGRPMRHQAVRVAIIANHAWVRPARGTPEQARAYCQKVDTAIPGTQHESGRMTETQGKRNDLHDVYDMIRAGSSPAAVLDANPSAYIKYHRGIEAATHVFRTAEASSKLRDVEVIVVYGPPGSGKTRWVWDTYGGSDTYSLSLGGSAVWWDGYHMQETVLMDDYSGQIPFRTLLTYLDRYPVQCPRKGSMVWLAAKRLILTSNMHWSQWYQADPSGRRDLAALQRRITEVRHVSAWGAEHVVETRGADPTDQAHWVSLPALTQYAPGFVPPQN